jgi:SAM-dependent methyltransferase
MTDASSLSAAWDDEADAWIAWARAPDHDHFYWRFSRPRLLELLPPPGLLTVDVGCGEGRLARELRGLGHRVLGVEASPRLAAAARDGSPPVDVVEADAAALPLDDATADLAVASMSLLNIADLDAAVGEVARVLVPGGRLCFSTVHPLRSVVSARSLLDPAASYFARHEFGEQRTRGGLTMTFWDVHRPLSALLGAFEHAGLLLEAVREPVPDDDHVAAHPSVARWREEPSFLLGRAVKPR